MNYKRKPMVVCSTAGISFPTTATRYLSIFGNATQVNETESQVALPSNGVFRNAFVRVTANAATNETTITLRVNGASTSIVLTIPALTTGVFSDKLNTVNVLAEDLVCWVGSVATVGAVTLSSIALEFS